MKKKILISVVLLILVLAGAAVLAFSMDFDSPKLGRRVMAAASEATGMDISAEGFRINLSEGLYLDGVEAVSEVDGGSYRMTLDRLVFEHQLRPLLDGKVVIDRILLQRPRVEVVESVAGESEGLSHGAGAGGAERRGGKVRSEPGDPRGSPGGRLGGDARRRAGCRHGEPRGGEPETREPGL